MASMFDVQCTEIDDTAHLRWLKTSSATGLELASANLASIEYNRTTHRLTGTIAVRNNSVTDSDDDLEVAIQYSTEMDPTCFAETRAQLLFNPTGDDDSVDYHCCSSATHHDDDDQQHDVTMAIRRMGIYAFSMRVGRSTISQIGQALRLRVVVRVAGEMVCIDDNHGQYYTCKAVPAQPRTTDGYSNFILKL